MNHDGASDHDPRQGLKLENPPSADLPEGKTAPGIPDQTSTGIGAKGAASAPPSALGNASGSMLMATRWWKRPNAAPAAAGANCTARILPSASGKWKRQLQMRQNHNQLRALRLVILSS